MSQPNCTPQVTPAGGAVKAFHALGQMEVPAVVLVDENGEMYKAGGSAAAAGLTDQELRAAPVPVSGIVVSAPTTPPVTARVSAAPAAPAVNSLIVELTGLAA